MERCRARGRRPPDGSRTLPLAALLVATECGTRWDMMWLPRRAFVGARELAVCAAVLASLAAGLLRTAVAQEDDVVARVNGAAITRRSVNQVVKSVITSNGSVPAGSDLGRLTDEALESLIDLELLAQEARSRNIMVSDKEIDEEIAKSRARFGSAAAFDEALRRSGLSAAALREETRKTLAVNRLLADVVWRDIRIPDSAVNDFFERNRAEFGGGTNGKDEKNGPDPAARKRIVRVLESAERERRQEQFVADLRRSARIERPPPGRVEQGAAPDSDQPPHPE